MVRMRGRVSVASLSGRGDRWGEVSRTSGQWLVWSDVDSLGAGLVKERLESP